jgi:nitrous oxidase accessory protein
VIAVLAVAAMLQSPLVVSVTGPYTSIAAAITAAPAGGIVVVRAGVYAEPTITINRAITLAGEPGAILDGGGTHAIIIVHADSVTIRGLEFRNTGFAYKEDRAAVRVVDSHDCTIDGNRFTHTFFAIYLARATGCTVRNNTITGVPGREAVSGNGIHLWSCREIAVLGNTIRGHRDGIYLEFTRHADVRGNVSEGNVRYGMHFMYSDSSSYTGNTFRSNASGVAVMYTRVVAMHGNLFTSNHGPASYGLLLKEIQDAHLDSNTFRGNTVGLMADGADRLVATRNQFIDNGWGVRLLASTGDGRFEANAFARNSFDIAANGDGNSTDLDGNWWDGYHGWDLDHDGAGDVPYRPMRLFAALVERSHPALLFQHALFVRLLDAAERVLPVLTPASVVDHHPLMRDPMIARESR